MRELHATRQFERDLKTIPIHIKETIDTAIQNLRRFPSDPHLGVLKLRGFFNPTLWRIRIGAYRLVYSFDVKTITLHRIRHRKDVYRNL